MSGLSICMRLQGPCRRMDRGDADLDRLFPAFKSGPPRGRRHNSSIGLAKFGNCERLNKGAGHSRAEKLGGLFQNNDKCACVRR